MTSAIWPGPVEKMNFPSFASLPKTCSKQLFIIMFWLLFWSTVWGSTSNGLLRKGFRLCALRLALWAKGSDFGRSFFHFEHRVRTLGVCALSCDPSKGQNQVKGVLPTVFRGKGSDFVRSDLNSEQRVQTLGAPSFISSTGFALRARLAKNMPPVSVHIRNAACQTHATCNGHMPSLTEKMKFP